MDENVKDQTYGFALDLSETLALIEALDFYSRIWIGQFEAIEWQLRYSFCTEADYWDKQPLILESLWRARALAFPELAGRNIHSSWGIWSDKADAASKGRAVAAYDMQQVIRYETAWHRNPEGGMTTWFRCPVLDGKLPQIACTCTGETDNDFSCAITLHEENAELMIEALRIFVFMENHFVPAVISCFTTSREAFEAAIEVESLIAEWASKPDSGRAKRATDTIASVDRKIISVLPPEQDQFAEESETR